MPSNIIYQAELRNKLLAGIDQLADTVKATIGPRGRNVLMYQKANIQGAQYSDRARPGAGVIATNDGVTIAQAIILPDAFENMGAQLLREVAQKTNDLAGDGTTTSVILAQELLHESFKNIAAGAHPLFLKKGILEAAAAALRELETTARQISSQEELSQVASVSCEDKQLGDLIGKALFSLGLEGIIEVEDSGRLETTLTITEGIAFDRGFISPLMATDEKQSVAELYDPLILLCDNQFTNPQDIIPVLILAAEQERPCLIISDGVESEALGIILENKLKGDLDIVCVTAPLFGEGRRWRMEDLAIQTGGVYITAELGMNIRKVTLEMLGTARQVKVTRGKTVIKGPGGDPQEIEKRIKELRHYVENTDYEFNRNRFKERLAVFVSGIAKIDIGARSEIELQEKKFRAEDAVNAARAAYRKGVVPGGGIALLNSIAAVEACAEGLAGDAKTGANAVVKALKAPARQIAANAGLDGSAVVAQLLEKAPGTGFDVQSGSFVDMLAAGIMDPLMVTGSALECAASVVASLLTSEAGVAPKLINRNR